MLCCLEPLDLKVGQGANCDIMQSLPVIYIASPDPAQHRISATLTVLSGSEKLG